MRHIASTLLVSTALVSTAVVGTATPAVADDDFLKLAAAMSATLLVGVVGEAFAPEVVSFGTADQTPLSLVAAGGVYGVLDSEIDNAQFGMGRVELRFPAVLAGLRPFLGVEVSGGGSIYGYAGGMVDVRVMDSLVLSPSIAAGYFEPGDVRDLGSDLQFRTGVEAAYEFGGGMRLGVGYHHISNANIDDVNPGTEILSLNFSLPLQ